jgi:hypothetical protein
MPIHEAKSIFLFRGGQEMSNPLYNFVFAEGDGGYLNW